MDTKAFLDYLKKEKKSSENTLTAYARDVEAFGRYMEEQGSSIEQATKTDVLTYIMNLTKEGRSRATTNRKLAGIRAAYAYLIKKGRVSFDPTEGIKTPRAQRKKLDYLTMDEMEKLLSMPDNSIRGKRDRAILEVLYGTGLRVMELIEMNYGDLNLMMGYLKCSGNHGQARIVPLGTYAKTAISEYLRESRPALLRDEAANAKPDRPLFVNYMGERFTRQGLWKTLSEYGKAAGLGDRITPHIIRNTFAVHMIQNGADLRTLQELMGYDDIQAMQAYMMVSKNRLKDVYDRTHPRA